MDKLKRRAKMTKRKDSKVEKKEKMNQQPGRKPYAKPQLIEYGNLEKLTQGATGRRTDLGTTRRR
jgi:hypothetical protein